MAMQPLAGGCQCGAIRYLAVGEAGPVFVCHCLDCQKQSGSAFGMSLVIAPKSFQLQSGTLSTFHTSTASGRDKVCAFCPTCGVRIYNATSALMSIKVGTLDDTSQIKPDAHYWTKRKQAWSQLPQDVPCYEEIG